MSKEYPLTWPESLPRNSRPTSSKFKTSLSGALKNVHASLNLFGSDTSKKITGICISSNVTLGNHRPSDRGVAVWFMWDDAQRCIAVDRYDKVECNLQAIHHIIEARRTEMRHGGLTIVRAAFKGFDALPSPDSKRPWNVVIGVLPTASEEAVREAYRNKAKQTHPDHGGDAVAFQEVRAAWEEYRSKEN